MTRPLRRPRGRPPYWCPAVFHTGSVADPVGCLWRDMPSWCGSWQRNRAVASRYEKLAVRYLATIRLAAINEWLSKALWNMS